MRVDAGGCGSVCQWAGVRAGAFPLTAVFANFAQMKEYQAVMLRLTHHTRDDEDALTDLLNERSRGGWEPALLSQSGVASGSPAGERLTVIFQRVTTGERT